jgi:Tfp pilus assembly protein PilN
VRPVNLIPPEEQRGERTPMRTGNVSYLLVGALALALIGVTAVALTSKSIADRKAERQSLQNELAAATARADSLRAFTDFRYVQQARTSTVASLAESRFDWRRVLEELSRVIPSDVWLISMTGTVSPAVQIENGSDLTTRGSVPGPALEIVGCAPDQNAVAGFLSSLEDIDGVTRVGIESSQQPDETSGATGVTTTAAGGTGEDCRTRAFIYEFKVVVAFDAVPVPDAATSVPSVPAPLGTGGSDGAQLADAQAQQAVSTASAAEQTSKAQQATSNLIPGG